MSQSLATLRADFRPWVEWLIHVAQYNGIPARVNSTYRSDAQQALLYQRYLRCLREGGECIPAAPPGHSMHALGLAADITFGGDWHSPAQEALGALWNRVGGLWSPRDRVHFTVSRL